MRGYLKLIYYHSARPASMCPGGAQTSDKDMLSWCVDADKDAIGPPSKRLGLSGQVPILPGHRSVRPESLFIPQIGQLPSESLFCTTRSSPL